MSFLFNRVAADFADCLDRCRLAFWAALAVVDRGLAGSAAFVRFRAWCPKKHQLTGRQFSVR